MTILIFTSQAHIYANSILSHLIQKDVFSSHRVVVFEEDTLVPRKTKLQGLMKYLRVSGFWYVACQISKQLLFAIRQRWDIFFQNTSSYFYPFERLAPRTWDIYVLHSIQSDSLVRQISALQPDLILSIYSKEIIPDQIVRIPKYGAINLHPGLLPMYRGVSPVFWALTNREKTVGATLHVLDRGIDTGDRLCEKRISTRGYKTEHALYLQLSLIGEGLVESYLQKLFSLKRVIHGKPFDVKKGAYYSLPTKAAVHKFLGHGYRFFRVFDFFF